MPVPVIRFEDLTRQQRRRHVLLMLAQTSAGAVLAIAVYFVLPLQRPVGAGVAVLIVGLLTFGVVLVMQVRAITKSSFPRIKAIGAIGLGVPVLLVAFSAAYYLIEYSAPGSFTEPLDKTGALYFTITVFATVGFGDIAPLSQVGRIFVSAQMLLDLAVIGIVAKVVVGAVEVGLRRRSSEVAGAPSGATGDDQPLAVDDPPAADDSLAVDGPTDATP